MKKTILLNLLFWSIYATAQIPFQDHVLHQNPADGLLNPNYATFTDIDGDGDMDVLGCTWYGKKFYWYENTDGQGTYGQQNIILLQYQASVLQPADIDGDGDMDFAAAVAYPQSKIIWFENTDGQGSFGPEQLVTTAVDYPRNLHVADIDNDGDLDLFSASINDDKLAWYENDGTGNFGAQQIISNDLDFVYNVTTADIDGDGDLDVLSSTSQSNPRVVWYENTDGQGTLGSENVIASEKSKNVKTGDFDGDGDIDVVFGYTTTNLYLYENDGTGTSWTEHIIDNVNGSYYVRVADLNNDGNLDILSSDLGYIYWYENDGTGSFGTNSTILSNTFNWHIETGDMNNDGLPEVIAVLPNNAEVKIFENSNGNFNQSFVINQPASFARYFKAADMDGDGDIDIIGAFSGINLLYYFQNDGQNNFTEIPITPYNYNTSDMKLADINDDGYTDIIIATGFETVIYTFDGNSNFTNTQTLSNTDRASSVDIADIIPGGYKEIIAFEHGVIIIYSTTDGINYSYSGYIVINNYSTMYISYKLSTGDVDGDGLIDIISSIQTNSTTFSWYKNLGNGSFGAEQSILSNASVKSFKLTDMDNDNDRDILLDYVDTNANERNIAILTNDGNGSFTQEILQNITPLDYYYNDIDAADLDNDGDNDIVYSNNTNIKYIENNGSGNYLSPQNLYSIVGNISIQITDVNNDNLNDIVAASIHEGKVFWLENNLDPGNIFDTQIHQFNIYPNPVTDKLTIDAGNITKIEILDRTGKLIKEYNNTNTINLSKYQKGLYLIRITDEKDNIEVQKILKK